MDFLNDLIAKYLEGTMYGVSEQVNDITRLLTLSPEQFSAEFTAQSNASYNLMIIMKNISSTAVVPIAYIILTFFAMTEMYSITNKHNNNHMILFEEPFKLVIKLFIGKSLIDKSFDILMAIFELTNRIIVSASNQIGSLHVSVDRSAVNDYITGTVMQKGGIEKLITFMISSTIPYIITQIMGVCITIIIFGRMIEIYLYTAVAPIPISMIMYPNSLSSTGKRFLLNYSAVVLQGVFLIIIVGIYASLMYGVGQTADMDKALNMSMVYGGVLIFSLFKSGGWAKQVLGA